MSEFVCCLTVLFLLPSIYITLNAQNITCNTTLNIPVILEKAKWPPDTLTTKNPTDGVSSRIRRVMWLKAANDSISITSFTLTTINEEGDILVVPNTGNDLSPESSRLINTAKKGATIYFECIRARSNAGASFILRPLTLTL